ncbi:hypothetical protein C1645_825176 [Glomus cerebriforme]|uniref:Uncharacterized protein n=1 Tax=Glomus cerebriforme TaxID=658196 RepID=A0A397SW58_9GLOM|nr:hypothetical protein C1645_825176 [Glomus cerebriforme]
MEYTFISRDTFNRIIEHYITNLPIFKQEKALINLELLNKIKNILLNPKDQDICNKTTRDWAKKKFKLEKIIPGDYRVLVKASNNPVLVVENMYGVLYQTYAKITQYGEQKQT